MQPALSPQTIRQSLWLNVNLDWNAYWERFKATHGDPVPFKGRLLFADGYMYSASDPAGPEWLPPDDSTEQGKRELLKLQMAYWLIRRRYVVQERDHLRALVRSLEDLQASRSVPLQHVVITGYDDEGKQQTIRGDVDVNSIKTGRLAALESDAERCDIKLKELGYAETEA